MDIELLEARSRIIKNTRAFFDQRQYLEVDTPLLAPDLIPETCLEIFRTEYVAPSQRQHNTEFYLVPSPEVWMKKLIAQKRRNIYQICKCFRNCESCGAMHSPEFTMLEYYTMDADYLDSLALTEDLFSLLLEDTTLSLFQAKEELEALRPPFERMTMDEAFRRFAGFSLNDALAEHTLLERARELNLDVKPDTDEAALYNLIFIDAVEPRLRTRRPVALLDYPAAVPCLAVQHGTSTKERWELYVRGIETANCYSEETSAQAVKEYFEAEGALKKQRARVSHSIDSSYWKTFLHFPRCSGVALGMDRLVMALTRRRTIDAVLPFG